MRGARHGHLLTLVALAVALGAVAQSISGVGFVLVCGPFLIAALGQAEGVRLAVATSLVVNIAVLAKEHRSVDWRAGLVLVLSAVASVPAFAWLLRRAPERLAEGVAGTCAVVGAAVLAAGLRWPAASGRAGAVGAGVVSAGMNVAAGISGPPVVMYADNAGWAPERTRGTLQAYFIVLNAVALLTLGLPDRPAGQLIVIAAAVIAGLAVGHVLAEHVTAAAARRTTLALAAAGGLVVLLKALFAS